jgi:hypothetical protein
MKMTLLYNPWDYNIFGLAYFLVVNLNNATFPKFCLLSTSRYRAGDTYSVGSARKS